MFCSLPHPLYKICQRHVLYQSAPNTTDKAVKLARKALNVSKDNTFTEDEINAFLPDELIMEGKYE